MTLQCTLRSGSQPSWRSGEISGLACVPVCQYHCTSSVQWPGRLRDLRAEPAVLYIGDSRRTPVRCKRGSPCRLVGAVPGLHESVCDGRFRCCEMRCRNVGSGGPGNQSDVSWPLLWARASGRGSGPWLGPGCCQLPATLQAATRSLHHLQAVRRNHSVNLRVPLERPSLGRKSCMLRQVAYGI